MPSRIPVSLGCPNSLIYKYFTSNSLFLKDLALLPARSLILRDRTKGGMITIQ
jgi:hypothetical protein